MIVVTVMHADTNVSILSNRSFFLSFILILFLFGKAERGTGRFCKWKCSSGRKEETTIRK